MSAQFFSGQFYSGQFDTEPTAEYQFWSGQFWFGQFFAEGQAVARVSDPDGWDFAIKRKVGKTRFEKKRRIAELELEIAKAFSPPQAAQTEYTPAEWVALFNALAGPAPDYAKPLADQITMQRMEEEDTELLLLSI